MQKYLFLDIDGVLNSERTVFAYKKLTYCGRVKADFEAGITPEPMFDPVSVALLRAAQEEIGFKIVISSTWRQSLTLDQFHEVFKLYKWDTTGIIVGKTRLGTGPRGQQIKDWLDTFGKYPYHYCILDDDSDMLESQTPSFVHTTFQNGLMFEHFEKIYTVLDHPFQVMFGVSEIEQAKVEPE